MFQVVPYYTARIEDLYRLPGFRPISINKPFLQGLGIEGPIDPLVAAALEKGSEAFAAAYIRRALTPDLEVTSGQLDADRDLEVHNYTGLCPQFVYEVNPSHGSCLIGCQYCLVTDGNHRQQIQTWDNLPDILEKVLERYRATPRFYYFSPKTEAFSEPHLQSGLAHRILHAFCHHYRKYPDSLARIFIASKAGPVHLHSAYDGRSILDLLAELAGHVQYNGSIGVMPDYLRTVMEPNAPTVQERLDAVRLCRAAGVYACAVLMQPLLLPYLSDQALAWYCQTLAEAGVVNIKPEFLTVDPVNLVAIAQFVHYFDPQLLKQLLADYVLASNTDHIKQRCRLAPDRQECARALERIHQAASNCGLSLTLCNWVKSQLSQVNSKIPAMEASGTARGFQCLGYQTRLLRHPLSQLAEARQLQSHDFPQEHQQCSEPPPSPDA